MNKQIIIFFIGVDKSGKTTISQELSKQINIPYFKNPSEKVLFDVNHIDALHYEGNVMYEFLSQTNYSIIRDRDFICEYAYSKAYNRKTDYDFIFNLDEKYSKLNSFIVYCYKDKYENFIDEYVLEYKIPLIKHFYSEYLQKTKIKHLSLNTTDENLQEQINTIMQFIKGIY